MKRSDAALLLAVPVWVWWALDHGGYPVVTWVLGLVYLVAAAVVLLRVAPPPPLTGARRIALAALGTHAAFACASIAWSDDRGLAWTTSTRHVLFAVGAGLVLAWPPTRPALRVAVMAFVAACVAGAAAGILSAFGGGEPLTDGRLTAPLGYPNATAALFGMGASSAVILAVWPGLRPWTRAAALGSAGVLAGASVMCQSRGGLASGVLVALVAVVVGPRRRAVAGAAAAVFAAALAGAPAFLDVRTASFEGSPNTALMRAVLVLVAIFVALVAVGRLAQAVRSRVALPSPSPQTRRWVRRALAAGVTAAGLVTVIGTDGVQWLEDRATDVATPQYDQLEGSSSRFTGDLGSNRVDYWRVSLLLLGRHPLSGTGAGGFAAAYLPERDSALTPLYAHSVWLQAAADLGLVGLLTLIAAAIALTLGVARVWRVEGDERALLTAAVLPGVYLSAHASIDWVSLFPALVVPALMLAASAAAPPASAPTAARSPWGPRATVAAAAVVALLAIPLALAFRYQERAARIAAVSPDAALADLRRAETLNPLAAGPVSQAGVVELARGRDSAARTWFRKAVQRDERAWFPHLMLGLLEARAGRRAAASSALNAALRLNPHEPVVVRAVRGHRHGQRPDPRSVAAMLLSRRS